MAKTDFHSPFRFNKQGLFCVLFDTPNLLSAMVKINKSQRACTTTCFDVVNKNSRREKSRAVKLLILVVLFVVLSFFFLIIIISFCRVL